MQIMMQQGINGRNIKMLMKSHEAFSQQVAGNPDDQKGQQQFFPSHIHPSVTEAEQTFIQEKQQQQGKIGEKHFIENDKAIISGK